MVFQACISSRAGRRRFIWHNRFEASELIDGEEDEQCLREEKVVFNERMMVLLGRVEQEKPGFEFFYEGVRICGEDRKM